MSNDMYAKVQNKIDRGIYDSTWTPLEEARLAREIGEVYNEGIPLIAFITDGAWSRRSYSNWNGPSTAMESDIIVEGFLCSEQMHGIKYTQLIVDGDSSVHRKLLETRHYGNNLLVEKTECSNHLLRTYCTALTAKRYSSNAKYVSKPIRDLLHGFIKRLRAAAENATKYRRTNSVSVMLLNGPSH
ncbi:hypothetical protein CBL_21036, partial [Carabus blaptoides fortunei]